MIIAGLAGDATYQIQEQEQAVLTTFGSAEGSGRNRTAFLRFLLYRKYRK